MRILIVGGSNMTGPVAVRELLAGGHEVSLVHRSRSDSPLLAGARQILGDKSELLKMRSMMEAERFDVAVHMVAFTREDAEKFMGAISGIVPRAVVISSIDVYRAFGRLHRTEPGEPDAVPLSEDAPLRSRPSIHGESRDKIVVEEAARSDAKVSCTVLRYPAVYGPGDRSHRLHGWVRRMDDGRPFVLMGKEQAVWRFTHGYVENVARALVLAITSPAAAGRTYNVGEEHPMPWAKWAEGVGKVAGWKGEIKIVPEDRLPGHLMEHVDFRQDWVVDTSRIRRELGYSEIVSSEECLRRTIEWERSGEIQIDPKQFDYAAEDAASGFGAGM